MWKWDAVSGLTSLNHDIMASYPLRLTPISQNLGPPSARVSVYGRIHEPIHSILRCSNTLWAQGAPQLFATTAVRLAELVLMVRYELIASRSLTQFLCKIYAFWPFWVFASCTRYVSYVGIKENLLGLVLRFRKIRIEKYVFHLEKYAFFSSYFVSIFIYLF